MTIPKINPYWKLEQYGSAVTIDGRILRSLFVLICMLTIGTNWLIPLFVNKIDDIKIRYEVK